ncbi:hypothetical protein PLESTF_001147600 [Pleodorina starrii]|nr:hypothetical protein PLESTF_001147600 [Pleodorina starrii]
MEHGDVNSIRQAVGLWHEKLLSLPSTQGALLHGPRDAPLPEERGAAVALAAEQLAVCLEDKRIPDALIDDLLGICETFSALCGVALPTSPAGVAGPRVGTGPLNPAKLKLLKAATTYNKY